MSFNSHGWRQVDGGAPQRHWNTSWDDPYGASHRPSLDERGNPVFGGSDHPHSGAPSVAHFDNRGHPSWGQDYSSFPGLGHRKFDGVSGHGHSFPSAPPGPFHDASWHTERRASGYYGQQESSRPNTPAIDYGHVSSAAAAAATQQPAAPAAAAHRRSTSIDYGHAFSAPDGPVAVAPSRAATEVYNWEHGQSRGPRASPPRHADEQCRTRSNIAEAGAGEPHGDRGTNFHPLADQFGEIASRQPEVNGLDDGTHQQYQQLQQQHHHHHQQQQWQQQQQQQRPMSRSDDPLEHGDFPSEQRLSGSWHGPRAAEVATLHPTWARPEGYRRGTPTDMFCGANPDDDFPPYSSSYSPVAPHTAPVTPGTRNEPTEDNVGGRGGVDGRPPSLYTYCSHASSAPPSVRPAQAPARGQEPVRPLPCFSLHETSSSPSSAHSRTSSSCNDCPSSPGTLLRSPPSRASHRRKFRNRSGTQQQGRARGESLSPSMPKLAAQPAAQPAAASAGNTSRWDLAPEGTSRKRAHSNSPDKDAEQVIEPTDTVSSAKRTRPDSTPAAENGVEQGGTLSPSKHTRTDSVPAAENRIEQEDTLSPSKHTRTDSIPASENGVEQEDTLSPSKRTRTDSTPTAENGVEQEDTLSPSERTRTDSAPAAAAAAAAASNVKKDEDGLIFINVLDCDEDEICIIEKAPSKPAVVELLDDDDEKEPGSFVPGDTRWSEDLVNDEFSAEILVYWQKVRQSPSRMTKKLDLRAGLLHLIHEEYPGASLHLVGSSQNGFDRLTSDVDLCLLLPGHSMDEGDWSGSKRKKAAAVKILSRIRRTLFTRAGKCFGQIEVIPARVPILRFYDSYGRFEVDLNVGNHVGIQNTHFLRVYAAADPRVPILGIVVKQWAKLHHVNNAADGTLSSYALIMMLIRYLQACTPPVVPCVHRDFPKQCTRWFHKTADVGRLTQTDCADDFNFKPSANRQSLADLLHGFFQFIANYNFRYHCMSVRQGKDVSRDEFPFSSESLICIEDPLDSANVARAVRERGNMKAIRGAFIRASESLKHSRELSAVGLMPSRTAGSLSKPAPRP